MTESALFYETASSGFGSEFLEDIQRAIDRLRDYPEVGEQVDSKLRRILLRRFPFSLIYAFEEGEIVIVAIEHHRREPGHWQSRVN